MRISSWIILIHTHTISVTEPTFWRNYFYRVTLEKQAVLSSTDIDPNDSPEVQLHPLG